MIEYLSIHQFMHLFACIHRVKDHIEEAVKSRECDLQEGNNVKQQVEVYQAAKAAIEEQRRQVGNLGICQQK